MRLYASGGCRYDWRVDPGVLIEEVQGYIAAGFSACKVRIGTAWEWDGVGFAVGGLAEKPGCLLTVTSAALG